ncbi:MAG: cysteine methyltransferase [Wenzhouxiangella sp.]|nr:MAG: cysteine methyltransferase [Wenzhouxiangella sp.]
MKTSSIFSTALCRRPWRPPVANASRKVEAPTQEERFRRIWAVVEGIPEGCVLNYGEVARLAGLPGRARLVGRALALAPKQRALPWHRVVNAQGKISFAAESPRGQRQRRLLEAEGVDFDDGVIDLERFSPERAIDRLLWGP